MGWGSGLLLLFVFALFLAAALLLRGAGNSRAAAGLPAGEIIFADDDAWHPQRESLRIPDLHLVGKPDYLVRRRDGQIVPVEVKSGRAPAAPHEGHVLQLAAYCLLVDENFGVRPDHGIIQSDDDAFAVEYTLEMEETLLDLLADMRADLFSNDVPRSHEAPGRCRRCAVREACDVRLA